MNRGFIDAWRSEWTKARTLTATGWLCTATTASGIGLSAAVCTVVHYQLDAGEDPAKLALSGVQLAQAIIAIWTVHAVAGEYRSGMMRTTIAAIPRRTNIVAAKSAVVVALTLVVGTTTVVGDFLAARILLAHNRYSLSPGTGATLRAGIGSILYLTLIGLLATGITLALRDAAAAIGTVLGLLYLFPLAGQLAGNPTWQRHLQQIGPTTAGLNIQVTTNLHTLPISPWAGFAILAAWAAAAMLVGGLTLNRQDL